MQVGARQGHEVHDQLAGEAVIHDLADRPATRRIAIASVALLLFSGIVALTTQTGSSGGVGDARLSTKGTATITSVSGERRTVSGTVALHRGETVEAIEGAMTLELPDGSTVEGRPSFNNSDPTRLKVAQPVELLAGDLLVTATQGTDVDSGGNRVHLDPGVDGPSAARLSRSLAVGAAVYRGDATFDSAGQVRTIPALRELDVSALGRPPTAPTPLRLNGDPWDRRFLGDAIDLGNTLDTYSAGYNKTLGSDGRTVGFYDSVLPSLANQGDFTGDLLASTPHPRATRWLVLRSPASAGGRRSFNGVTSSPSRMPVPHGGWSRSTKASPATPCSRRWRAR